MRTLVIKAVDMADLPVEDSRLDDAWNGDQIVVDIVHIQRTVESAIHNMVAIICNEQSLRAHAHFRLGAECLFYRPDRHFIKIGIDLHRNRNAAEIIHLLILMGDDDDMIRNVAHLLLPEQRSAATFNHHQRSVELIRPIYCDRHLLCMMDDLQTMLLQL